MLLQADEAEDEDADEDRAPDGDNEGRREKYVGVKVKVSCASESWAFILQSVGIDLSSALSSPLDLTNLEVLFLEETCNRCTTNRNIKGCPMFVSKDRALGWKRD